MNHPCWYHKANEMQRHDAEQIIKEYAYKLQWRSDGNDSLMDVGCGSGDVLIDFIYTIMPAKFERVVGSDISPKMISYAKDFYNSCEKCEFKVLDIASEKDLPNDIKEKFDHVTSFYCLHWVQNKILALRNIYNLLRREGGDCFLVLLASNPIYDVYNKLSKSNKWCSYMQDVDKFVNHLHYSSDPKLEFSNMLQEAGFSDNQVDVKHKVYTYEDAESLKASVKAICPFLDRMPISLHESFMNDIVDILVTLDFRKNHPLNEAEYLFVLPYTLIIAYAKKFPDNTGG